MKKIISILACVCLLLSVMIVPIAAAETSATITFNDKAKRTTFDTSKQIWTEGGITVTNNKGASTSNVADYANPARFYKSSELIIEYPGMTKIEFDANSASYATALKSSITVGTVAVSSDKVTVVLGAPVDSYTIASLTGGQVRMDAITVYAEATTGGCAHEETTIVSNGDETHSVVCSSCEEIIVTAPCQDIDLNCVCDTCEGEVALPETLTIAEAIALGAEQATSAYTADKYFVTGQITSIDNDIYGNMYIADKEGNNILIYGTYNADGTVRYDKLETKPVVGDTIKVLSVVGNFNGTPQLKEAWIIEIIAEEEEIFEGTDPEAPIQLAVNESVPATLKEIKVPAEGTVFVQAADANGILHVTSADGTYMLINGMANQATADAEYDLTLCGYEMVNIYNPGAETITLYVFLEAGAGEVVGTWENPEVLELQVNEWMPNFPPSAQAQTELAAGNQGYFYVITATANGAFAVSITANDAEYSDVGYQFSVTNNTTSWQSDFIARAAGADDYYDTVMIPVNAGDELLINAGTFDAADMWNAPAGTLNVNINFAAVGSYEYPVVLEETGAYAATVEAESQGYYYEYVVTEDGTVTVTMNDEAGWQYNISKVPVDEDDYANYYNSDTHWYDDETVVATETVDVVAGETVKVWVNTYDSANPWNPPAGTVNWTLAWTEKVEEPAVPGAFSIDDVDAVAGEEFQVVINISENPGIIGATLDVNYDANVLELVSAEAGDLTNGSEERDEVVLANYNFGPIENSPFVITWVDALAQENVATNGVFVTLTFKVKEDAAEGTTDISITADADDIFDKDFNNVEFTFDGATVSIAAADNSIPGDVNGDGNVNSRDYAMLIQYLNDWDVTIDEEAADVNDDGNINSRDYAMLIQYLNDWPVELK